MVQPPYLVEGEVFKGKINVASDNDNIVVNYGKDLVIIEKIPGAVYPKIENVSSGEMVVSNTVFF